MNVTSYFASNIYFTHNEWQFHSEFHSKNLKVYFERAFYSGSSVVRSGMKNGMELNAECVVTNSGFMHANTTMISLWS